VAKETLGTVELVQSDDVCVVEKVKRLHHEIQFSMLTNLEELQHTQIKLHLVGGCEGVAPKPRGRVDNGNAPLRFASNPVSGSIGLPLPIIKMGAASMLPNSLSLTPEDFLPFSSSPNGKSNVPLNTKRCR
jgi:hypothetical protein